MTDKIFAAAWAEALSGAYTDRDAYISDLALSSIWGDAEGAEVPQARIDALGSIWDAAHLSIKDIRAASGLSQAAFARHLCIPKRTVEDWERGARACPGYLRLLIAEHFGIFRRYEVCKADDPGCSFAWFRN